jgi:hypothetical protein
MAQFTFNGSQELTYPNLIVAGAVLVAEPGQAYDLDTAPDALWSAASAPVSAPAPQPAPAPQAPETAPEAPVTASEANND